MDRIAHGVIRGKMIEVAEDLGITDGQRVEIIVRVPATEKTWGEGIRESAGGWVDYPGMDEALETIRQSRRLERRQQVPE